MNNLSFLGNINNTYNLIVFVQNLSLILSYLHYSSKKNFSIFNLYILSSNNILPYSILFIKKARNIQYKLFFSWTSISIKKNLEQLLDYYMSAIKFTMRWKFILIYFFYSVTNSSSLIIFYNAKIRLFVKDSWLGIEVLLLNETKDRGYALFLFLSISNFVFFSSSNEICLKKYSQLHCQRGPIL